MKRISYCLSALLFASGLFVGCSEDSAGDGANGGGGNPQVEGKIFVDRVITEISEYGLQAITEYKYYSNGRLRSISEFMDINNNGVVDKNERNPQCMFSHAELTYDFVKQEVTLYSEEPDEVDTYFTKGLFKLNKDGFIESGAFIETFGTSSTSAKMTVDYHDGYATSALILLGNHPEKHNQSQQWTDGNLTLVSDPYYNCSTQCTYGTLLNDPRLAVDMNYLVMASDIYRLSCNGEHTILNAAGLIGKRSRNLLVKETITDTTQEVRNYSYTTNKQGLVTKIYFPEGTHTIVYGK